MHGLSLSPAADYLCNFPVSDSSHVPITTPPKPQVKAWVEGVARDEAERQARAAKTAKSIERTKAKTVTSNPKYTRRTRAVTQAESTSGEKGAANKKAHLPRIAIPRARFEYTRTLYAAPADPEELPTIPHITAWPEGRIELPVPANTTLQSPATPTILSAELVIHPLVDYTDPERLGADRLGMLLMRLDSLITSASMFAGGCSNGCSTLESSQSRAEWSTLRQDAQDSEPTAAPTESAEPSTLEHDSRDAQQPATPTETAIQSTIHYGSQSTARPTVDAHDARPVTLPFEQPINVEQSGGNDSHARESRATHGPAPATQSFTYSTSQPIRDGAASVHASSGPFLVASSGDPIVDTRPKLKIKLSKNSFRNASLNFPSTSKPDMDTPTKRERASSSASSDKAISDPDTKKRKRASSSASSDKVLSEPDTKKQKSTASSNDEIEIPAPESSKKNLETPPMANSSKRKRATTPDSDEAEDDIEPSSKKQKSQPTKWNDGIASGVGTSSNRHPNGTLATPWSCANRGCTTGMTYFPRAKQGRKVISELFGRNKKETRSIPDDVWHIFCRKEYQRGAYRVNHKKDETLTEIAWKLEILREQLVRLELWRPKAKFDVALSSGARTRLAEYNAAYTLHNGDPIAIQETLNANRKPAKLNKKGEEILSNEEKFPLQELLAFNTAFCGTVVDYAAAGGICAWIEGRIANDTIPCMPPMELLIDAETKDEEGVTVPSANYGLWLNHVDARE